MGGGKGYVYFIVIVALALCTAGWGADVWDAYDDYSNNNGNPWKGWFYIDSNIGFLQWNSTVWAESGGATPWIVCDGYPAYGIKFVPGTLDACMGWIAPYSGTVRITGHQYPNFDPGLVWLYNKGQGDGVVVQVLRYSVALGQFNVIHSQTLPDPVTGATTYYMDFAESVEKNDAILFCVNKNGADNGLNDVTLINPRIELERKWDTARWRSPHSWEYDATTRQQKLAVDGQWFCEYNFAQSPHDISGRTLMRWETANNRWKGDSGDYCQFVKDYYQYQDHSSSRDSTREFVVPETAVAHIYTGDGNNVRKPWPETNGDGCQIQIWHNTTKIFDEYLDETDTTGWAIDEMVPVTAGDRLWFQNNKGGYAGWDQVVFEPVIELILVETPALRVTVGEDGELEVKDKTVNHTWRTYPLGTAHTPENLHASGNVITWDDPAGFACTLTVDPTEPEMTFELSGDAQTSMSDLHYPNPFYLDTTSAQSVIPAFEGLVIPSREYTDKPWNALLHSNWFGLIDQDDGYGCMTILDDFADTELVFTDDVLDSHGQPLLTFRVKHRPELGKLGYNRKVTFCFTDSGGYVAQAKRARQWAQDNGYYRSLADKATQNTDVNKMKGAVDIYFVGLARPGDFADWLLDHNIDRAIICAYTKSWEDSVLDDLPISGGVSDAIDDGFVVTSYDIYTDVPKNKCANGDPTSGRGVWYDYETFHALTYPDDCFKNQSLDPEIGWAAFLCPDGHDVLTCVNCTENRFGDIQDYLPAHLQRFPGNAHFVDCESKTQYFQCWDATYHPHTAAVGRRNDILYREKLLDFITGDDTGEQNLIAGSEGGMFWAIPNYHYSEDLMSVNHYQYSWCKVLPNDSYDGPIWRGDYWVEVSPGQWVNEKGKVDDAMDLCYNQDIRVPLYQLAFHDAAMTTWRWTEGQLRSYERDENGFVRDMMWKKDLFNLLYGTMPLWMMRGDGRSFCYDDAERLEETFQTVCAVNKYTAFDELLDHEVIANTNGDVQRTTWQTGDLTITVNFSDTQSYTVGSYQMGTASYVLEGNSNVLTDLTLDTVLSVDRTWSRPVEVTDTIPYGDFEDGALPVATASMLADVDFASGQRTGGTGSTVLEVNAMGPNDTGVNNWEYVSLPVGKLEEGAAYGVGLWVKLLDDTGSGSYLDHPGITLINMVDPLNGSALIWGSEWVGGRNNLPHDTWTYFFKAFTVPANTTYSFITIGSGDRSRDGALFQVDDVSFVKLSVANFDSIAADDGFILESGQDTWLGNYANATETGTIGICAGDTSYNGQTKSVLSFNTASLPDTAVIWGATLTLTCGTIENSPESLGSLAVDIKNGATFGNQALETSDWQSTPDYYSIAIMSMPAQAGATSTGQFNVNGLSSIDKQGITQLKLRLSTKYLSNNLYDYYGFHSGDSATVSNRPKLVIMYKVP